MPTVRHSQPSISKTAALYLRVSTTQQTEKYGLQIQETACRQYAAEKGYRIVAQYVEGDGRRGVSGGKTSRPEIDRILRDARQTPRPFEALIVYDTSRLARDDFSWLANWFEAQLADRGVRVEYARERFDPDPAGQLTKQVLRGLNTYQKQNTAIRDREAIVTRAKQGLWPGGIPPLGYDVVNDKLTLNPEEAALVERIFKMYAIQRLTVSEIGEQLYRERIPGKWERYGTKHQKKRPSVWEPSGIYYLLQTTAYVGRFLWGKKKNPRHQTWLSNERVEIPCPRIISDELWAATRERMAANRLFGRRDKKYLYLLSGIIRCQECGWLLRSMPTKRASLNYYFCEHRVKPARPICPNCARFRAADIDPVVWDVIVQGLRNPQHFQTLLRPHLEALAEEGETTIRLRTLQQRLALLEKKAEELLLLDTSTALAREQVVKRLAQLDEERTRLRHEEASLQATGQRGSQSPVPRAVFFEQMQQWLLGTTLAGAEYEDSCAGHRRTVGSGRALTAPVPQELLTFLFQIRQRIVRELVSAVYVGPDGSGTIVLRADGSRLPIQAKAQPPKKVRSLKEKMKSG